MHRSLPRSRQPHTIAFALSSMLIHAFLRRSVSLANNQECSITCVNGPQLELHAPLRRRKSQGTKDGINRLPRELNIVDYGPVPSPVFKERVERKSRAVAVPVMVDGADKPQCRIHIMGKTVSMYACLSRWRSKKMPSTSFSHLFLCYVGMEDCVIDFLSFHRYHTKVRLICGGRGKY